MWKVRPGKCNCWISLVPNYVGHWSVSASCYGQSGCKEHRLKTFSKGTRTYLRALRTTKILRSESFRASCSQITCKKEGRLEASGNILQLLFLKLRFVFEDSPRWPRSQLFWLPPVTRHAIREHTGVYSHGHFQFNAASFEIQTKYFITSKLLERLAWRFLFYQTDIRNKARKKEPHVLVYIIGHTVLE